MSLTPDFSSVIDTKARYLLTDSRQVSFPEESIFFAIKGERHDGHLFLPELHKLGVREFVVEKSAFTAALQEQTHEWTDTQIWVVPSAIRAMQQLVSEKRRQFGTEVVGIAGSNGKTIVKEWLTQLMAPGNHIVASPKSYNSQIGVPLSVWNLSGAHTLAIFEAGISRAHEMEYLQPIIQPTTGIFTNIGSAHDDGFRSRKQKISEKLRLFTKTKKLIYRKDYEDLDQEISLILRPVNPFLQTLSWGKKGGGSDVGVKFSSAGGKTNISLSGRFGDLVFSTAFRDDASLENLMHCIVFMLDHELTAAAIQERIHVLKPVTMSLELKEGINHCHIVDDTYNNDLQGLTMALNFLSQQEHRQERVVILSDVLQTGQTPSQLYALVAKLLKEKNIQRLIGIGSQISSESDLFDLPEKEFYHDTDSFLHNFSFESLSSNLILVKGARPFSFEKIINRIQQKVHGTVLEINLDALVHNLNYYRAKAGGSKIMVMVKAFAYGSGSSEVAALLQYHRVDYLGVAYADEAVVLRKSGITLPIMVMNATPAAFDLLLEYHLEPEIYSRSMMQDWLAYISGTPKPPIHIKLDTGMHRMGFVADDYEWLTATLIKNPEIRVASIFSHLVGADEGTHNAFSKLQFERFVEGAALIEKTIGYPVIKHILNSAGIVRFPDFRLDMVRLGIGLYGVEASGQEQHALQTVGTLKTIVSQIKYLKAGETVGYSRRGQVGHDSAIATLAIGYADGYDRGLGNGVGSVWVNGTLCPTIGNVCMDMTMVDVTLARVEEGSEVVVFGKEMPINNLAKRINTIPYEILTGIGERVKRVFYKE